MSIHLTPAAARLVARSRGGARVRWTVLVGLLPYIAVTACKGKGNTTSGGLVATSASAATTAPSAQVSLPATSGSVPQTSSTVLASGLVNPIRIVVGSDSVLVAEQGPFTDSRALAGTIKSFPKTGGEPKTLASHLFTVTDLLADDSRVYWAACVDFMQQGIWATSSRQVESPQKLFGLSDSGLVNLFGLDDGNVAFSAGQTFGDGVIETISKTGRTPKVLFHGPAAPHGAITDRAVALCMAALVIIPENLPTMPSSSRNSAARSAMTSSWTARPSTGPCRGRSIRIRRRTEATLETSCTCRPRSSC